MMIKINKQKWQRLNKSKVLKGGREWMTKPSQLSSKDRGKKNYN